MLLVASTNLRGQPLPFDATAPDSAPQAVAISGYVKRHVEGLRSSDRAIVSSSRQALLQMLVTNPAPSTSFLEIYSREIASQLGTAFDSTDVHVRVNAAIALERVARFSLSPRLTPLVIRAMADESPAISVWGLNAAQSILPRIYQDRSLAKNDTLLPAVLATPARFPREPAIAQECYDALTGALLDRNFQSTNRAIYPDVAPFLITATQQMMRSRLSDPNSIEPSAEQAPIRFLTTSVIWDVSSEPQRSASAQLMVDWMTRASTQFMQVTDRRAQEDMRAVVKQVGNGLALISKKMTDAGQTSSAVVGLNASAESLMNNVSGATPPANIVQMLAAAQQATAAVFKDVKLPSAQ
jgi:hypothetical protein